MAQTSSPNFYDILGVPKESSIEQIQAEFKIKSLETHPDKFSGLTPDNNRFQEISLAKSVLSDPSSRKVYDAWLEKGQKLMTYSDWVKNYETLKASFHFSVKGPETRCLTDIRQPKKSANQLPTSRPPFDGKGNALYVKFRNYEI